MDVEISSELARESQAARWRRLGGKKEVEGGGLVNSKRARRQFFGGARVRRFRRQR